MKRPWSNQPRKRIGVPISPRSISCFASIAAGVLTLLKATMVFTPVLAAAAAISFASSSVTASGF